MSRKPLPIRVSDGTPDALDRLSTCASGTLQARAWQCTRRLSGALNCRSPILECNYPAFAIFGKDLGDERIVWTAGPVDRSTRPFGVGPPVSPEIGRSPPTTSNGPAKSTEAVVSTARCEPTERWSRVRRFSAASLFLPPQPSGMCCKPLPVTLSDRSAQAVHAGSGCWACSASMRRTSSIAICLGAIEMRMFVAFLVVLGVVYAWDDEYNNGKLADGVVAMGRSITHNMGNR